MFDSLLVVVVAVLSLFVFRCFLLTNVGHSKMLLANISNGHSTVSGIRQTAVESHGGDVRTQRSWLRFNGNQDKAVTTVTLTAAAM